MRRAESKDAPEVPNPSSVQTSSQADPRPARRDGPMNRFTVDNDRRVSFSPLYISTGARITNE